MSDYKTLIAKIIDEFKSENKQITSLKILSTLKNDHGIKLSNSEVKKIIEESKLDDIFGRDINAEIEDGNNEEDEDESYDEIDGNIESFKTYNNDYIRVYIPKDYFINKFKNEKESNGKYGNIVEFIINKFDLDFIPTNIYTLVNLLPNVKESYNLKNYSGCDKYYENEDNEFEGLNRFRENINIINTYSYDLNKILSFIYSETTDKCTVDIIKEIYYNPLFKGEFELNAVELRIIVDYIANKDINGNRLIKSLEYFRK